MAPSLGAADTFAVLGGTTVTNTGPSMIVGDIGLSPASGITGFPPGTITGGTFHDGDAAAAAAQTDVTTAYDVLAAEVCDTPLTGDLGGLTLTPGVYCLMSAAQLTGTLFLDGLGDPNAVFVFQVGNDLTTAATASVVMIGGAIAGRVFWQVGGSATLGAGTQFSGNILAMTNISLESGTTIAGRVLARDGCVTLDTVNGQAVSTTGTPAVDAACDDGGDMGVDAGPPDLGAIDAGTDAFCDDAGDAGASTLDLGMSLPDLGSLPLDAAGPPVDLGSLPVDAAMPPLDLGTLPLDAAMPPLDLGTLPLDLGTSLLDLGTAPRDAGTSLVDSGMQPLDAGTGIHDAGLHAHDGGTSDGGGLRADASRPTMPALSGGALPGCSTVPGTTGAGGTGAALLLFGLFAIVATRRRRAVVVAAVAALALVMPHVAHADSLTLNQFHAPETSLDGLEVSRPVDMGHLRVGANVYLDYAHNPLVYERVMGDDSTQENSIVNHQLAVHATVALGLFDRLVVFVGGTGNLVMEGDARPGYVPADGTRMGDLNLGARVRLIGVPRLGGPLYGALAVQVGMSLPTAHLISNETHYSGDGAVMVTPELLGEVGFQYLRVTMNLGTRLRDTASIDSLNIGPELTWGIGVGVPLIGKTLEADVEMYGATTYANFGRRANTPLEAIAGLRWRDESGWTVGVGAGPGLARGYGSPDFRAIATLGWTMPDPAAAATEIPDADDRLVRDSDHDGIVDTRDVCPHTPGPASNNGCALHVRMMPSDEAPNEIVISDRIEFDTDASSVMRARSGPPLEEVLATLQANPQLRRIAIEGHADERYTDEHNMILSQKRAEAVMRWLVEHGINAERLQARGYGEREPFVAGTTPEAQQTNRNVQFFILDPPASHPSR